MEPRTALQDRLRWAELNSSIGAGVLGIGLGVITAGALRPIAVPIVVVGGALHVWGMLDRHRIQARAQEQPLWSRLAYWLCWGALVMLAGYLILARWRP